MSDAFSVDVAKHLAAMRRYARSLVHDAVAADDLVQQSLLRGIEGASTFRHGASLKSWLLAIVHNQFISGRRHAAVERRGLEGLAQARSDDVNEGEQEQALLLRDISARFAALPEPQRAVLHLVAIEGLSYRETADALSIPIGTVMSRLGRARAALRDAGSLPDEPRLRLIGGRDA